jgi:hypothetical protein
VLFHALFLSVVVLTGSKQGVTRLVGHQESLGNGLKGSIGSFIKNEDGDACKKPKMLLLTGMEARG